ncbi:MAG: ACT domain-containing protein [Mucilaginibacter sp.]
MKAEPTKNLNENIIIAVYADDKKGLLGQILMIFNRRNITVHNLNISRTDIKPIVLVTLEVQLSLTEALMINHKVQSIIEVHKVMVYQASDVRLNKIAFFKLSGNCIGSTLWMSLQKFGAQVTEINEDSVIVQKIGSDEDLHELYSHLDGKFLISYCKSTLVASESLIALDVLFQEA